MIELEVTSWDDFGNALEQIDENRKEPKEKSGLAIRRPLFRGVSNATWGLETTLERAFPMECSAQELSLVSYYRKLARSLPAVETMTGRKWDDLPDPPEFERLISEETGWLDGFLGRNNAIYRYLIYLRHHGFPSPLLDWTQSPYVAAFFAFDSMGKDVREVAIYTLVRGRFHTMSNTEHFFVVGPYVRTHARHYLQQSQYSLCVCQQTQGTGENRLIDYTFQSHYDALRRASNRKENTFVKIKIRASLTQPSQLR